ncbi:hypothetical protein FOL47_003608, partial [Perkinsus chesapeaki]
FRLQFYPTNMTTVLALLWFISMIAVHRATDMVPGPRRLSPRRGAYVSTGDYTDEPIREFHIFAEDEALFITSNCGTVRARYGVAFDGSIIPYWSIRQTIKWQQQYPTHVGLYTLTKLVRADTADAFVVRHENGK